MLRRQCVRYVYFTLTVYDQHSEVLLPINLNYCIFIENVIAY